MNQESNKVICPKCGEEINVNDVLHHQVEEQLKKQYNDELTKEKEKYESKASELSKEQEKLNEEKRQQDKQIADKVNAGLKQKEIELKEKYKTEASEEQSDAMNLLRKELEEKSGKIKELNKATAELEKVKREKKELADSIKAETEKEFSQKLDAEKKRIQKEESEEQSDAMNLLRKELEEKSGKIKELNKATAELEKVKREKKELADSIKAETEKEFSQKLDAEKKRIQKEEQDKNELKKKELEKKLEDQKRLTEEMKRKQEQGSMQIQGEVQELVIEEWLSNQFPLDTVEEIKKGERGGDCVQTVNTRTYQNCGTIYYESKRTKAFQQNWIEKFKADMLEKKTDIGVLVTEAMPLGMERFGLKDGIWICSFEEFKGLCTVLRESIIKISATITTRDNKGNKMGMLYDFLTSNEFRLQIETIVEGFSQMQTDLITEKRAMTKIWSKREKQIEKVISNTVGMYGSIKGIAGNAIQSIQLLELPSNDEDE